MRTWPASSPGFALPVDDAAHALIAEVVRLTIEVVVGTEKFLYSILDVEASCPEVLEASAEVRVAEGKVERLNDAPIRERVREHVGGQ